MTSGDVSGTSRDASGDLLRAYLVIAVVIGAIDVVNVFTALGDSARYGARLAAWEPLTWEVTSGLATLLASVVVYADLRLAPPESGLRRRVLAVHGAASLIFSGIHVGLMTAARIAIYSAAGSRYGGASPEWLYEFRKDLLAYLLIAGIFWFFTRERDAPPEEIEPARPATFDIPTGAAIVRVRLSEVLAVRAAGNYVEFVMVDGTTHLMRQSMRGIEEVLGPAAFVRTHRSWLVNRDGVRAIEPTGSGDYQLRLGQNLQVPLSRRYPDALGALRDPSPRLVAAG